MTYLIGFPASVLVIGILLDRLVYGNWVDWRFWRD